MGVLLEDPDLYDTAVGEGEELDDVDGGRAGRALGGPPLGCDLHDHLPAPEDPRVCYFPVPVLGEATTHRIHSVLAVVPPTVREGLGLFDAQVGMEQLQRSLAVTGRKALGQLPDEINGLGRAIRVAHDPAPVCPRPAGSILGKNPWHVPLLTKVMARSRSNVLPWRLSSARTSAMPITARAETSVDSEATP